MKSIKSRVTFAVAAAIASGSANAVCDLGVSVNQGGSICIINPDFWKNDWNHVSSEIRSGNGTYYFQPVWTNSGNWVFNRQSGIFYPIPSDAYSTAFLEPGGKFSQSFNVLGAGSAAFTFTYQVSDISNLPLLFMTFDDITVPWVSINGAFNDLSGLGRIKIDGVTIGQHTVGFGLSASALGVAYLDRVSTNASPVPELSKFALLLSALSVILLTTGTRRLKYAAKHLPKVI